MSGWWAEQPSLRLPRRMRSGEGNLITHTEAFVPSALNKSFAHGAHGVTIQGCDSIALSAARAVVEQPRRWRTYLRVVCVVAHSAAHTHILAAVTL